MRMRALERLGLSPTCPCLAAPSSLHPSLGGGTPAALCLSPDARGHVASPPRQRAPLLLRLGHFSVEQAKLLTPAAIQSHAELHPDTQGTSPWAEAVSFCMASVVCHLTSAPPLWPWLVWPHPRTHALDSPCTAWPQSPPSPLPSLPENQRFSLSPSSDPLQSEHQKHVRARRRLRGH